MRVAVDIGFGFVKVLTEHGQRKMFPSLVKNRIETGLKGIVGGYQDDYAISYQELSQNTDEKNNVKKYYVGDAAMTNGGDRNWEDKNTLNVDDLKILITTAVGLVNPNNETVDLSVGLPMSFFNSMKDDLKNVLESIHAKISISGINDERSVEFNSIFTFPQGAGAYWSAILDTKGSVKDYNLAVSTVAVIDIGYRTVDYLVMKKGRKGINMIEDLSGSLEDDGMNKTFQDIQTALIDDGKGVVDIVEIEKAILWFGGKLDIMGEEIDLTKFEEAAYRERAEAIASKIKRRWGKQEDTISTVLITGGGGNALFEYIKDKFKQSKLQVELKKISDDKVKEDKEFSSYANCAGYLGIQAKKIKK